MKKLYALFLVLAMPVLAQAGGLTWAGGDYSVSISTKLDLDTVGAYDFKNGNWLTGISKDLLISYRKDRKLAYLAGEQLFNLDNDAKGALGFALGIYTGSAAQYAVDMAKHFVPDAQLPSWAATAGNYLSIEGGYGYRIFGCPEGQTPTVWTVGGKVNIPIEKLWKK